MRAIRRILLCGACCLCASVHAAEREHKGSAEQRWSETGPGGSPDFVRHVVPLFSKLGCNKRACHGSFQGQSGFRLSLFGFEPEQDLAALLEDDGDGLRANVKNPDASLALFKPTHEDEHEGGRRMEIGSWQHRLLRQWIADGAKFDATGVAVQRLEIQPAELVFQAGGPEQTVSLRSIAYLADGSSEEVTGLTVFSSNDKGTADVSADGAVTASRAGDTAIVARYAGHVTSVQVLVPRADDGQPHPLTFPHNPIDELVGAKLEKLRIRPSDLCGDGDFIRRVYLDVIGALPTSTETREFLADRAPDKRAALIDRLLDDPAYARYWGMKFSDWTGNSKYINNKAILSNWLWQQWIEEKLARNVPYDEIVYGFICESSLEDRSREAFLAEAQTILHRAAGRYNYDDDGIYARRRTNELYWSNVERRDPDTMVLQTANSFLGLRLECAQCHNHPFDRWTQQDFQQFKSFFMLIKDTMANHSAAYRSTAETRAMIPWIALALLSTPGALLPAAERDTGGIAIPQLIDALADPNLRQGASIALIKRGEPAVLALQDALATGSRDQRVWSAYTLGQFRPPATSAVKPLALAAAQADPALRAAAAEALGRTGDPAAVVALTTALGDAQVEVRRAAAAALGAIGPPAHESTTRLIAVLPDPAVRLAARDALLQIGPVAGDALVAALDDERLRFDAAIVLKNMAPAGRGNAKLAHPTLADLACLRNAIDDLTRPLADRSAAAQALAALGEEGLKTLIEALERPAVASLAARAFAAAGPAAAPRLAGALTHKRPEVRAAAADALGRLGPAARDAAPDLIRMLKDEDRDVRYRAVRALHEFGPAAEAAVAALTEVILNSQELEPTRQWAIKTLVVTLPKTHDAVVEALVEASKEETNYGVRQLARQQLQKIDTAAANAAGIP